MAAFKSTPRLLSLGWLTVSGAHPLEQIEAAVAGGFDAVGLRMVSPPAGDPMVPIVGDEPLVRTLRERLDASGVVLLDVETVWIGPDFDVQALQPVLDAAQRMGARNLLTMGNDPHAQRLAENFASLCEMASHFGLGVGMEFSAYSQVPDLQAARRLVRAAAQPTGGILLDALHFARSGGLPADLADLQPGELLYCQLADARGPRPPDAKALRVEARGQRWLPGEGELPLGALLRALPPDLPLVVEVPSTQLAALPYVQRAARAGEATRRFLDQLQQEGAAT